MKKYDGIVVGGGAAGLCFTIMLLRRAPKAKVLLIEALDRVGKKLAVTGNGQCNITNNNLSPKNYHSTDSSFVKSALTQFGNKDTEEFFSSLGVLFAATPSGKVYPYSYQATSVVDALRFAVAESGAELLCGEKVTAFCREKNGYLVTAGEEIFWTERIVFATGLTAGGERLGSDGSGLALLQKAGLAAVPLTPAIVQVRTENTLTRQLKGVKVNAAVVLTIEGKETGRQSGEVLFTDYGLSGPPVLQLSGCAFRRPCKAELHIDLMPDYSYSEIVELLNERFSRFSGRNADQFFCGLLQNRIGRVLMKECGFVLEQPVGAVPQKTVRLLADKIKNLTFAVTGHNGFSTAQVTAGGLDPKEFDSQTMENKRLPGLYAIGELLDVDGDCGGYNLQWAWSSAFAAANHMAKELA